jgi:hypothetical protein
VRIIGSSRVNKKEENKEEEEAKVNKKESN